LSAVKVPKTRGTLKSYRSLRSLHSKLLGINPKINKPEMYDDFCVWIFCSFMLYLLGDCGKFESGGDGNSVFVVERN
jgi:hypothetical protein